MVYNYNHQVNESNRVITKLILICVGSIIGMSLGLYVAARTLPLPNQTTVYVLGGQ